MRSWLYVPGDSERKLTKAAATDADVCIADLEDGVAPKNRALARTTVIRLLRTLDWGNTRRFVRIDPAGSWQDDIIAAIEAEANGIVIPKASSPDKVERMVAEAQQRNPALEISLILTEDASGVHNMDRTLAAISRPAAAFFGTEDLAASLGVRSVFELDGTLAPVLQTARSLFRLATAALGVPAIETPCLAIEDLDRVGAAATTAARHGFAGMQAIHPAHIPIINRAFVPTTHEIQQARDLVSRFEEAGGGGALREGGQMVDHPHLKRARQILATAQLYED